MGTYLSTNPKPQTKIPGRVAVVTGANRGLGYQTARSLYELGATVYLGCRSESKALDAIKRIQAEVSGAEGMGELKWFKADMSSIQTASEGAEEFLKVESRLDILVLNAGISDRKFELNEDGIEVMMAVNHFGPFVFTTKVLDMMKRTSAQPGSDVRIVCLSSMGHGMIGSNPVTFTDLSELKSPFPPTNFDTWMNRIARYGRSKLANILFVSELQSRLDAGGHDIIALSVHPGTVATGGGLDSVTSIPVIGSLARLMAGLAFASEPEGNLTTLFAATDPAVRAEADKYKGKYLTPVGKVTVPSKLAQDVELGKKLWEMSGKAMQTRSAT